MLTQTQQTYLNLIQTKQALKETLSTFPNLENSYTFTDYDYLLPDVLKVQNILQQQLDFIQNQLNVLKSNLTPEELNQMYAHLQNEKA